MSITTFHARRLGRADGLNSDHYDSAAFARPAQLPADFDLATHPIIARHWFGIEPPHSIGPVAAEIAVERGIAAGLAPKVLHALGGGQA